MCFEVKGTSETVIDGPSDDIGVVDQVPDRVSSTSHLYLLGDFPFSQNFRGFLKGVDRDLGSRDDVNQIWTEIPRLST